MPSPSQAFGIVHDPEVCMEGFEEMSLDEAYRIIDGKNWHDHIGYDKITCKFIKSMRRHIGWLCRVL
jgi:hypothetical protein